MDIQRVISQIIRMVLFVRNTLNITQWFKHIKSTVIKLLMTVISHTSFSNERRILSSKRIVLLPLDVFLPQLHLVDSVESSSESSDRLPDYEEPTTTGWRLTADRSWRMTVALHFDSPQRLFLINAVTTHEAGFIIKNLKNQRAYKSFNIYPLCGMFYFYWCEQCRQEISSSKAKWIYSWLHPMLTQLSRAHSCPYFDPVGWNRSEFSWRSGTLVMKSKLITQPRDGISDNVTCFSTQSAVFIANSLGESGTSSHEV